MKEAILREFQKNHSIYIRFCDRVINLISDLLYQKNIVVHNLNGRVKSNQSLSKKSIKNQINIHQ